MQKIMQIYYSATRVCLFAAFSYIYFLQPLCMRLLYQYQRHGANRVLLWNTIHTLAETKKSGWITCVMR